MGCASSSTNAAEISFKRCHCGNAVATNAADMETDDIGSLVVFANGDADNNMSSGRMKLWSTKISVLLVFGKEDAQSESLRKAAEKAGYRVTLAKGAESAVESYLNNQQDLVVIDCRHSIYFDYDKLCRSMKGMHPKAYSRFLAITSKCDKDEPSIIPYLQAGFTRRMVECTNIASCFNELVSIERGEIRPQQQLQAYHTMALALQNIDDSVEITDHKFKTEFVNSSYEKQTGYSAKEVVGTDVQDRLQVDNCNEEQTVVYHMKKNEQWEGLQSVKRKNGDIVQCRCKIIPVEYSPGKVTRYILLRKVASFDESWDRFDTRNHDSRVARRDSYLSLSSFTKGLINFRRAEARRRFHSLTIEAPINKVISMLCEAQDSSTSNKRVVEAIDNVLEILRTTELFAPNIHQVTEEDPLANDYVEGLCDQSSISSRTRDGLIQKQNLTNRLTSSLKPQMSTYHSTPEIEELLQHNGAWDFDIIELEDLSSQSALVPLGLKIFERFGVLEYLGVDESVLVSWLQLITSNYHSKNSYHNATHAADVLQATAFFLEKIRPKYFLDTQHEVAALVAAVIHDVDHPARTSKFLLNSKHKLALLYNDTSVLENHHAATGFRLTHLHSKSDILKNLKRETYDGLRKKIIDMVIYTDMGKHFETVEKFSLLCSLDTYMSSSTSTPSEPAVKKTGAGLNHLSLPVESVKIARTDENSTQILRMAIKVADVSNPARPERLMKIWAYRIAEEYFDQFDEEQELNLPAAMPTFRRSDCNIPKSQLGFAEIFLDKMFTCWNAFIDVPEVVERLQDNYRYWQRCSDEEDKNSLSTAM